MNQNDTIIGKLVLYEQKTISTPQREKFDPRYGRSAGTGGSGTSSITVDDKLSSTSTNPVQNKVVTEVLNECTTKLSALENIETTINDAIQEAIGAAIGGSY